MRSSGSGPVHASGLLLLLASIPGSLAAATYTVSNTNDSGSGSLRQAILSANANAGKDSIHFQIPGAGVHTIAPASPLPVVTDPVVIRGHTQPGFSGRPLIELNGTGAGAGANGLQISSGDSEVYALAINRFQGIFLGGGGNGIVLEGEGLNIVSGCFLGTNATGTAALGNLGAGILISSSPQNQVGPPPVSPPSPLTPNVFSGNSTGVLIVGNGSDANNVSGNTVGMDPSAQIDLGNSGDGIAVTAGTGNVIQLNLVTGNDGNGILISAAATGTNVRANFVGTSSVAETRGNGTDGIEITGAFGNLVTENEVIGNGANGILLFTGATNNTISGNVVGTNRTWIEGLGNAFNGIIAAEANDNTIVGNLVVGNGTNGIRLRSGASGNVVAGNRVGILFLFGNLPNGDDGIEVNDGAVNNVIGGTASGHVNFVSGNNANGIRITDPTTTGNVVQGNRFGATADAVGPRGNLGHGVLIENGASGNTIGGVASGARNLILFNGGDGIFISSGSGNALLGNGIDENAGLGIDLAPDGVTGNDPGDGDTGPNQLQNTPLLTSGTSTGGSTSIQGSLASSANTLFRLEFFASAACDTPGVGEGGAFLGSADVTTDGLGTVPFDVTLPVPSSYPFLTATATDPSGNTSEFSSCVMVPGPTVASIAPTSGPAGGGTSVTVTGSNFQNGAAVTFGGSVATATNVNSPTEATATTPALAPGTLYDVVVTNPNGLSGMLTKGWLADFADVPAGHIFHSFIETIFRGGITAGCNPGSFCPAASVTRAQVAVFLLRSREGPAYAPPPATGTVFEDIPVGAFAAASSSIHAAEGVTAGCGGGNYCPDGPVTREQMAVMLLRTSHGPAYVPPDASGVFLDVPVSSPYARWIEQLAAEGITGGCGAGLFCPQNPNTRGQMAVFLVIAFGLP